jgi:hypothetical protein
MTYQWIKQFLLFTKSNNSLEVHVEQFAKIVRAYKILIKNLEEKNSVERTNSRSDNNIKKECRH